MASTEPWIYRHEAMATWFEVRCVGCEETYARQAAAEAFRRVDHLEGLLSRFRETSEVSAMAQLKPGESLRLHPDTFACLSLALEMQQLTAGAFDPALGGGEAWEPGQIALHPERLEATCLAGRVHFDLGAIGKGFALDCASEVLRDWDVPGALLIAGGSSILAHGIATEPWAVGINAQTDVLLQQGSIGCSGLAVKGHHILDPRTRQPACTPARVWVLAGRAAVSDALSTGFMVLSEDEVTEICAERPELSAIIQPGQGRDGVKRIGRGLGVTHQWRTRGDVT